ncbi:MAG: NAD(P)H-dependent flavin oxidoreductase [Gammaproteobacteria bacterium]
MWPKTVIPLVSKLGIRLPIIQAPMAGGPTTPELVAAVANAGALGSIGAGYMTPEAIRKAIQDTHKLTPHNFSINLFVPQPADNSPQRIAQANQLLQPYRTELGLPIPAVPAQIDAEAAYRKQLDVILEEQVPIISFAFGFPDAKTIQVLKERGVIILGTATTVDEAIYLEKNGCNLIVAQGSEAGGHRGTFLGSFQSSLIGTMALVPQIVDKVKVPVIAAGGIMDGRGLVAACALGAAGVQMGTAFLTCKESGAHPAYKDAILNSTEANIVLTTVFSGKPARGIENKFIQEMTPHAAELPGYPIQHVLTQPIRQEAAKQNRSEFMSLWAGQGTRLSRVLSAEDLIQQIVAEARKTFSEMLASAQNSAAENKF